MIVDTDIPEFPALEAGLIVLGMVVGKGHVMVTACPPDLSVNEGDVFFLGQGRQGRGGGVF